MTSDKAFKYSFEHNALGITTSASVLSASGSLSLDINKLLQSDSFLSSLRSVRRVIKIGSSVYWNMASNRWIVPNPISQEPLEITLTPITEFLSCPYTVDRRVLNRKSALARALTTYPSYKKAHVPPDDHSLVTLHVAWPKGTYGLVKPVKGCLQGSNSGWESGWRKHDTEDRNSNNDWSSSYNLAGWKGKNNMQWEFCIKVTNGENNINYPWPEGTYCILKKGNCPNNFHTGGIYWDDEDNKNANKEGGTLPDGDLYGRNTRIDFCCRRDGSTENLIVLPTNKPFILVAATNHCQQVYGMHLSQQWFYWDNEDNNNADSVDRYAPYEDGGNDNHKLHFCYYTKY